MSTPAGQTALYLDPERYPERPNESLYDDPDDDLDPYGAIGDARQPDRPDGPSLAELDFGDTPWLAHPELRGIPAAGWSERITEYVTWTCDCKATAKSGIPPRHVWRPISDTTYDYPPTLFGVLIADREEKNPEAKHGPIKRDETGRPIIPEAAPKAPATYTSCPTWRTVTRFSVQRRRDWSKLGVELVAEPVEPAPPAKHPAGPEGPLVGANPNALSRSAKQLMPYAKLPVLQATGRLVADGATVVQHRLVGADGRWVAYFTDGAFTRGVLDGQPVKFNALRSHAKAPAVPASAGDATGAGGVSRDDSPPARHAQGHLDLPE